MAPLPPETTARFWLSYTVADVEHELMVRFSESVTTPDVVAEDLFDILGFLVDFLPTTWAVQSARVAGQGDIFSLPFDLTGTSLAGFIGDDTDPFDPVQHPRELIYVGRSPFTGRRSRFSLYGAVLTTPANYRLGPGETVFANSAVFAALNAASAAGRFICIDGTRSTWYTYVNVQYNSYWESERRTG